MRRLARILLNAATATSLVLALVAIALWVASRAGYRWSARSAPEDGRLWSVRSEARAPDRFAFFCVAPWPHAAIRDANFYPEKGSPSGLETRVFVQVGIDPSRTRDTSTWDAPGLTFRSARSIVATWIGPQMRRPGLHDEPVWNVQLAVAYWLPAVAFGLPPLALLAARRLTRRCNRPGLCPACGYDLRATPERCPECGRGVSAAIGDAAAAAGGPGA